MTSAEPGRRLSRQFRRFLVTGAVNTLLTYGLYQVVLLMAPYWAAFSVSYATGVVFSWRVNSAFSLSVKPEIRQLPPFAAFMVFHYLLGLAFLALLIERAGMHERIAPLLVIAVLVPLSFAGTRWILAGRAKDGA